MQTWVSLSAVSIHTMDTEAILILKIEVFLYSDRVRLGVRVLGFS